MLYRPQATKLVSRSDASSWRNRKCVNGPSEKITLSKSKMKGSICFKVHWLSAKKTPKKSMHRELKRLGSRRLRIRKEHSLRSKENASRCSERCTKPAKMWRSRVLKEILSRNTLTSALLFTHQLLVKAYLLIKKLTNMRYNQRLSQPIRGYKS